ncbi:uncharacterized protein [Mytilus edulis]|uniref:uncharacterized protein n=1 Tax=Mytilus edulis TaxID=6550 RepID=UPI0039EED46C
MEENQLGSIVECYLTGDDDKDVSNIQNDNSSEDPFNEEQQKRKEINGTQHHSNTTSQSPHIKTSSVLKNIQASSHETPNKDLQLLRSKITSHSNVNIRMPDDAVKVSSNRNSRNSHKDDQNRNQQLRLQPESTELPNTPNKKPNDTEIDARPMTPHPTQNRKIEYPQNGAEGGTLKMYQKTDEMRCFENDILRPRDHCDQPLTGDQLMEVVIVYAKSDYDQASRYKEYLEKIAEKGRMPDITIVLYTSEDFPNNDVKVVEEVVNRSMRVLMLLSGNFATEVNLNFIKEETIGLTRLQEIPPQEQMSLFATTIMNRKKNCIRPVHTVSKKDRYYKTPVGLSVLRPFEFFDNNKNQKYEDDIALSFLKKAREDRLYHTNELRRHQALDNTCISQITEKHRANQYLKINQTEFDTTDKTNKDESLINNTFRSTESKQQHSIREMPMMTSNGTGTSARSIPLENSTVVCPSKQEVELIKGSNTKPIVESSCLTSGYVSHLSCEHVRMGKEVSLPAQNAQNNVPSSKTVQDNNPIKRDSPKLSLHIPNTAESFDPVNISSVEKDGESSLEHGDEEEDTSADSILPKTSDGLKSIPSLMSDSLVSDDIKEKQDKFPPKSHLGYKQQDVIQAKMKLMNLDGSDDVRESKVSYSGPSGRSGIRTGANPGYDEYLVGTPNGRRSGSSHAIDDSAGLGTSNQTTNRAPNLTGYPPPQSIHYHYHYPDQVQGLDVDVDQGPGTFRHQPESRRPPASVRRRLSSPNRVNSGPIFNIQGCATVQIGDANVVKGDQTVEATNNNRMNDNDPRNNENEQRDDWSPESPDSQRGDGSPESAGIIMEEPIVHGGQPEGALNILSPSKDPVKKVEYESSDNNSDEDNSNIPPEGKGLDSAEMFGNGADLNQNLSSSFTDQNKTEKAILKDEIFQKAHNSGNIMTNEKGTCASDKDITSMESSKTSFNVTSLQSSTKNSLTSLELVSLSSHLRKGTTRKDSYALKFHYSQNVRCELTCSGALHDDDVD